MNRKLYVSCDIWNLLNDHEKQELGECECYLDCLQVVRWMQNIMNIDLFTDDKDDLYVESVYRDCSTFEEVTEFE